VEHTQAEAVAEFRALLTGYQENYEPQLAELRGKNLACWCKPGDPCHADVLIELANTERSHGEKGPKA